MAKIIVFVWRLLLILVALAGVGHVISRGFTAYHESLIADETDPEVEKTLAWDSNNSKALRFKAKQLVVTDPQQSAELARKAYILAPTNGSILLVLANLSLKAGDMAHADRLAKQAAFMDGADPSLSLGLAQYWDTRKNVTNVIAALSNALTARPTLGDTILPLLLKVAENPSIQVALFPVAQNPLPWWDRFYSYAAERAITAKTVNMLMAMRRGSKTEFSDIERKATVSRFIKDGEWPQAYLLWVNGLDKTQMSYLGGVFDGGFEIPATNYGFDWHVPDVNFRGARVNQEGSYGIRGELALHVAFEGIEFRFAHVYQYLFLNAGEYQFSFSARTDSLQGLGGVSWTIACADSPTDYLVETDRLIGTNDWRYISTVLSVPQASCSSQVLTLRSFGKTIYDNRLEGDAWFDAMQIIKVRGH